MRACFGYDMAGCWPVSGNAAKMAKAIRAISSTEADRDFAHFQSRCIPALWKCGGEKGDKGGKAMDGKAPVCILAKPL